MARAVQALQRQPLLCLVDGNQAPDLGCAVRTVVGGDGTVESIMAASIVAKVARDMELMRLDADYPAYGLARHKGYGTPQHLSALQQHGPCAIHRMSFAPCARASGQWPVMSDQKQLNAKRPTGHGPLATEH
jgi:ribonuclease HII